MSLVSVIVPVYNGSKDGLEDCLRALLAQTHKNIEFVIIDDYSSDDSYSIINNVFSQVKNAKLIHHVTNKGLSASLNDGIRNSNGKYLLIIQQDCILLDNKAIGKAVSFAENTVEDVILLGKQVFSFESMNFYQNIMEFRLEHIYRNQLVNENVYLTENKCDFLSKSVFTKIGYFDEELRFSGEDQIFSKKVISHNIPMIIYDELQYTNTLYGENSLKKILKKEYKYGKFTSLVLIKNHKIKTQIEKRDFYLRYKIQNRVGSLIVFSSIVSAFFISLFSNGVLLILLFLSPLLLRVVQIYEAFLRLRSLKNWISIGFVRVIAMSFILDLIFTISLIHGFILYVLLRHNLGRIS